MGPGDSRRNETERRNRLAYLALHYAIQGEEGLSERIREMIWRIDSETRTPQQTAVSNPVTA